MLRNLKLEKKLKEIGVKDPAIFIKYNNLENKNIIDKHNISFWIIIGIVIITFIYMFMKL
jgi:hypothetical protein